MGSVETTVLLGRMKIKFQGDNLASRHIIQEISEALPSCFEEPDLTFFFVNDADGRKFLNVGGISFSISDNKAHAAVRYQLGRYERLFGYEQYRRMRDWNYLSKSETAAKNFMYNIFDWLTHICQLDIEQSYMHASAITKKDRTLAVLGQGGVGKTTTMLKLCIEDGWKYLSDDLAVIDKNGMVYRSPKRLQIYAYNIAGQKEIAHRLMGERSIIDRMQWRYREKRYGPKNVRRRVSAENILGRDHVAKSGLLTDLVFLERGGTHGISVSEINSDDVSKRMAPIVMSEIEPYSRVNRECSIELPALSEVESATRAVLKSSFSHVRPLLMVVGSDVGPNLLADAMRDLLHKKYM